MHAYMTNRQALQRANVASFTLPGFAQDGFPHLRSASLAKIGGGMRLRGQAGGRPCRWVAMQLRRGSRSSLVSSRWFLSQNSRSKWSVLIFDPFDHARVQKEFMQ
jgi:hypothetical protein